MRNGFFSIAAGVQYLETTKAACTSIKLALLASDGLTGDEWFAHLAERWRQMPDDFEPSIVFTFVRNPFDRLVSAWAEKLRGDKAKLLRGRCPLDPSAPFADFARWVCDQDADQVDRHWGLMGDAIDRQARIHQVDPAAVAVFHFEDLADAWRDTFEPMGLPPIATTNQAERGDWLDYYDCELVDLVAAFYAADLDRFGYHQPTPKELTCPNESRA